MISTQDLNSYNQSELIKKTPKIAIVHDWITGLRGGERVLETFLSIYPEADIFTLIHVPGTTTERIDQRVAGSSFLQNLPYIKNYYRYYLPFYPYAAASIDLSGYDFIISLSHAAAKNVRIPEGAVHICYCFTPMRYIWDQTRNYFGNLALGIWPLVQALRGWDRRGSRGVDHFVAISKLVAARIRSFYHLKSTVINPSISNFWFEGKLPIRRGEAFLYAGALVPYKRIDLLIEACNYLKQPLWVVGEGPQEKYLKSKASRYIQFFGRVDDFQLRQLYSTSRALLFGGEEDFGLIPIECQAAGRPVIGYYQGGLRETVNGVKLWNQHSAPKKSFSGVFVLPGKTDSDAILKLVEGIRFFLKHEDSFNPSNCLLNAEKFSHSIFRSKWHEFINSNLATDLESNKINPLLPTLNSELKSAC